MLVVAFHATTLLLPEYRGRYASGGFIGVDVFFVLSGFLITSLLLEEHRDSGRVSFTAFYRRRALRLFPGLWAVMVAQLAYTAAVGDPLLEDLKGLLAIFFYIGNWSWQLHVPVPLNLAQTWSLAVEEQFYLAWPLALFVLMRLNRRWFTISAMSGLAILAVISRSLLWHRMHDFNKVYVQTEVRFDALMIGALLAYLLHTGWRPGRGARALGAVGAAFIALVAASANRSDGWLFEGGYTLVALATASVLCAVLDEHSTVAQLLGQRLPRAVGRLSYSIYLWHVLVFLAVQRAWPQHSSLARAGGGLGLTAVASVFSYYVVEQPFLRRKRRPVRAM